jgi:putative ABC transport system permease protein
VVQQVLSETLLLALAGGALGFAVANFGVTLIVKFLGDQQPKSADVYPDAWVLAFTLGISVFAGLMAGLLPALRLTKGDVNEWLKQGLGRTTSDSGGESHSQCSGSLRGFAIADAVGGRRTADSQLMDVAQD